MPIQIVGRTSWVFETMAEGQAFRFEIIADTRVQATQKLHDALLKIAADLEAENGREKQLGSKNARKRKD
jgi:hypothetical protein